MEIIMTKNIRKSFKYSVYVMLTACTVIFGSSSEARASDIFEEALNILNVILLDQLDIVLKMLVPHSIALHDQDPIIH